MKGKKWFQKYFYGFPLRPDYANLKTLMGNVWFSKRISCELKKI